MKLAHEKSYTYDIESYPNFFSCVAKNLKTKTRWIFEVSDRVNNAPDFFWYIRALQQHDCEMIGFNVIGYDYRVIHRLMQIGPTFTYHDAYQMTQDIIVNQSAPMIWPSDYYVRQIDLFKIHHFDNVNRSTSLKQLEAAMRSHNVGDLPFPPGTFLTDEMKDEVIRYNCEDVDETEKFALISEDKINFRKELSAKTGIDMTNYNDTKIGKKFFEMELEKAAPGITGTYKNPNRTEREYIDLGEVILPIVEFQDPAFQNVLNKFRSTRITNTNSPPEFKNVSATVNGFTFDFGMGGIHGSVSSRKVVATDDEEIIDVDVTSYYPTLAIEHKIYPEHLSEIFCDIYKNLFDQRKMYEKGTPENAMLKLALNGVYGDSNNKWSRCFFDPKYTMAITINGQLLLCMLAEQVLYNTDATLIQANTDGMTFVVPKRHKGLFNQVCDWWCNLTKLELESANYSAMWIKNVSSYTALYTDGKVKHKKDYTTTREWHQDHGALVVPKAVEAFHLHGTPVEKFIRSHQDPFDFMLMFKVTGKTRSELVDDDKNVLAKLQKVTRYHISTEGGNLRKVMPPLAKAPDIERPIGVNVGWRVHICNKASEFRPDILNYDWYIREAEKLIIV